MEAKHTPSPWEPLRQGIEVQSEDGNHEAHAFVNGIPAPVCEVYANMHCEHDDPVGEYRISKQEGLANLFLIAAAPELLEALKDACDWLDNCPLGEEPRKAVIRYRAAIAKATRG